MHSSIRKAVSTIVLVAFAAWPLRGYCLPSGEQVVEGSAAFDRSAAHTLNINQATDKLIANYDSFSIAQPETVRFLQPSSSSIALNRVVGADPSAIMGTLSANGRIFLVNPNGVLFGAGSRVDAAGLVASTLNIKDSDFMAGRYTFFGNGGAVINQGYIAAPGGYVALLGSTAANTGVIEADLGSIALAAGNALTLSLDPRGLINVVIDEAVVSNPAGAAAAVSNSGALKANAGKVVLSAKSLDGVFKNAINTSGIIEANAIDTRTGAIVLQANQRAQVGGSISAAGGTVDVGVQGADYSGSISARSAVLNQNGGDTNIGDVNLSGDYSVYDEKHINVTGTVDITDGSITMVADSNNDHEGDLTIDGGSLLLNGGTINLGAENMIFSGALIENVIDGESEADEANIFGTAKGMISMSGTDVFAGVYGNGDALVQFVADGAFEITGDSSLISTVTGTKETGYLTNLYLQSTCGPLTIDAGVEEPAYLESYVGSGNSVIFVSGGGKEGVSLTNCEIANYAADGGWTMTYVEAENGQLNIDDLYAESYNAYGDSEFAFKAKENVSISNSYIDSYTNSGDSDVYFSTRDGGVSIVGGTEVISEVGDSGLAGIYFKNNDESTEWNAPLLDLLGIGSLEIDEPVAGNIRIAEDSSLLARVGIGMAPATAVVYLSSDANISVEDTSSVAAEENNGKAAVAMLAGGDITTSAESSVSASSQEDLAGVVMLAKGAIDAQGAVAAESNYGFGGVAMLAYGDINAANVSAYGGDDAVSLLEELAYDQLGIPMDIGMVPMSSAVVLSSVMGDITLGDISADAVVAAALGLDDWFSEDDTAGYGGIFSSGLVNAKYLGMLARNDIGIAEAPIATQVDTLSAYSYDKGDIYINEADDLEVGALVKVWADVDDVEEEDEGGGDGIIPLEIGLSVAAADGIVNIVSNGNMLVNSIIAPKGGVYLESSEGSIFAGRGWEPSTDEETIGMAGELAAEAYSLFMSDGADADFFSILIADGLMPLGEGYYYTPAQIGSPLYNYANVIAGGYSYFYAPNGKIGVGSVYDSGSNPYLSGEVMGILRPNSDTNAFADPTVGLDPDRLPPNAVFYDEDDVGVAQVYPDPAVEAITAEMSNPLWVDIRVVEGAASAVPAGFVPQAALTLAFGSSPVPPPPPPPNPDTAAFVVQPFKTISVYYEQNNARLFSATNLNTPLTLFGYRPLVSADLSAFNALGLDVGAYEFISNNINLKQSLAPFFGQLEEKKKKQ